MLISFKTRYLYRYVVLLARCNLLLLCRRGGEHEAASASRRLARAASKPTDQPGQSHTGQDLRQCPDVQNPPSSRTETFTTFPTQLGRDVQQPNAKRTLLQPHAVLAACFFAAAATVATATVVVSFDMRLTAWS